MYLSFEPGYTSWDAIPLALMVYQSCLREDRAVSCVLHSLVSSAVNSDSYTKFLFPQSFPLKPSVSKLTIIQMAAVVVSHTHIKCCHPSNDKYK